MVTPNYASLIVHKAVKEGRLVRQPCEVGIDCKGRVVAHHDDYDRPLDVRWFCERHHRLHHYRLEGKLAKPRERKERNVPTELLELLRGIARQREEKAAQIRQVVAECRDAGATWEQIGAALGVSRQAAHNMYGKEARR